MSGSQDMVPEPSPAGSEALQGLAAVGYRRSTCRVPVMQEWPFSRNKRWAEAVRAERERLFPGGLASVGAAPDPVWAVLMALPGAVKALAEEGGSPAPSLDKAVARLVNVASVMLWGLDEVGGQGDSHDDAFIWEPKLERRPLITFGQMKELRAALAPFLCPECGEVGE